MSRVLFVAAQSVHARGIAERLGIPYKPDQFIGHEPDAEHKLRGQRGVCVVVVETARQRPDFNRILELLRVYQCVVFTEQDYGRF